jgi:BCD family chlorophyll transporter-like MFS transporter
VTDLWDHTEAGKPSSLDAPSEEREPGAAAQRVPEKRHEPEKPATPVSPFREVLNKLGPRFLPFADAATPQLPMSRLLRLSLFQVTVGMALVLVNGTLNRVMILDLAVPAWLVALMIALPLVFAPFRALLGFKSDTHRSLLGWKRVPYIWFGTLLQFGGLAIMPFSLILLSGDSHAPPIVGNIAAALAFLLVGAGLHTTQTAGLALATDLAPEDKRPRVVAFLYVMLLLGMTVSAVLLGRLLADFSQMRLIEVIQGAALATMALNLIALWKQEPRRPRRALEAEPKQDFSKAWHAFMAGGPWRRIFVTLGFGTVGFSMQDILIEPYGGQVLQMTVAQTTALTALFAVGALLSLAVASRRLDKGADPYRLAAYGVLVGLVALTAFIFSAPLGEAILFEFGVLALGFGSGFFAAGTLTAAMELAKREQAGLALGAWGAVGASATGGGIALGGALRDVMADLASRGSLGPALMGADTGYLVVYHVEIALLFVTLAAIGPLVRTAGDASRQTPAHLGLADFPG